MENKQDFSKNLLFVLVLLLISIVIVQLQSPVGLLTTPDSINYLDMAQNIYNGNGAVVTDRSLASFDNPQKKFLEQRLWPKLYPYVLSPFANKIAPVTSIKPVAVLLLFLSTILVYGLFKHFLNASYAFLIASIFAFAQPMVTVFAYVWSETLFIPLFLGLLYSSYRYLNEQVEVIARKWIVFIVLCVLGLSLTRYIGAGFFLLLPLLVFYKFRSLAILSIWFITILLATLIVAAMLIENYQLTGSFSGGQRNPSDKNFFINAAEVFRVLLALFIQSVTMICSAVLAIFIVFCSNLKKVSAEANANFKLIIGLSFSIALGYFCLVIALRSYSVFDDIDVRLLAPGVVGFWCGLVFLSCQLLACNKLQYKLLAVVTTTLALTLSANGALAWVATVSSLHNSSQPSYTINGQFVYNNLTLSESFLPEIKVIKELVPESSVIAVSGRANILEHIFARKTYQLPVELTEQDVNRLNRLPIGAVIVLDNTVSNPFQNLTERWHIQLRKPMLELGQFSILALPIKLVAKNPVEH